MDAEPPASNASWWRRRVLAPILGQLRQGITPQLIALTIAAGLVIGIVPILGVSTPLCAVFALALRLNQPIIQLVNYLAYPLQLALLFPFLRAGERLFGQPPLPLLSMVELSQRFHADPQQFLVDYGLVALYGFVVWGLLAPLLAGLLYFALRHPLQRMARRLRS